MKTKLDILLKNMVKLDPELLEKCPFLDDEFAFVFFIDDVCYTFWIRFGNEEYESLWSFRHDYEKIAEDYMFMYSSDKFTEFEEYWETRYHQLFESNTWGSYFDDIDTFLIPKKTYILADIRPIFFEVSKIVEPDIVYALVKSLKENWIEKLPDDYQMINYFEGYTQKIYQKNLEINKKYVDWKLKWITIDYSKLENLDLKNLYEEVKKELEKMK